MGRFFIRVCWAGLGLNALAAILNVVALVTGFPVAKHLMLLFLNLICFAVCWGSKIVIEESREVREGREF